MIWNIKRRINNSNREILHSSIRQAIIQNITTRQKILNNELIELKEEDSKQKISSKCNELASSLHT